MSILVTLIIAAVALAAGGWIFRWTGQMVTGNAPYFRDMPYGSAFGYVVGAALLLLIVWLYYLGVTTPAPEGNKYFFFVAAVQGFILFAIAAFLFRMLGRTFGSEASKKLFRQMPVTAAFGVMTIFVYAFLAIFAGQIALSTVLIVAAVCIVVCLIARQLARQDTFEMLCIIATAITGIFVAMYFLGGIAPHGQEEVFERANILPGGDAATGGDPAFPLGTDQIGRDILSRLIYGAQNTVGIAFATTCLAFLIGITFGFLAAIRGGWVDQFCSRVVDALMAIPQLIFALLLMTIATAWAGSNTSLVTLYMILIIAVLDSTRVYRLSRAVGLNIVVMDYIEAAKLRGETMGYLIFREILPNAFAPLMAEFGLRFCFVFLTIASLSFLGIGIQPPLADWGTMVRDLSLFINYAQFAPLAACLPLMAAGAIALLTVGVNFVVDWMLNRTAGLKD